MFKLFLRIALLLGIWFVTVFVSAGPQAESPVVSKVAGKLYVIHAGSLSVPFRDVTALFNTMYPNVEVLAEAHGSRDCARKVRDLDLSYDVMGSADYSVIDILLIPDFADLNIRFATNEMAIAYTEHSKYADEITGENWPEIMLRDDVAFGRADPNRDPCGYRTVMTFQLADKHYGPEGLGQDLADKDGLKYIRPKETDLLALLEAGEIDYLFIYRSVAEQHGLDRVLLPDEVNLKSAELAELYATAAIELTGKEPGTFITKKGAPMVYGVCIPKNTENRELAEAYLEVLLSPAGQAIMEKNGQPSIAPGKTGHFDALPENLKPFCEAIGE